VNTVASAAPIVKKLKSTNVIYKNATYTETTYIKYYGIKILGGVD